MMFAVLGTGFVVDLQLEDDAKCCGEFDHDFDTLMILSIKMRR
jgi:hypothetical protein